MKKVLTRKEWRRKKLVKELIGIVIAIIGLAIFISSCCTGGPTIGAWRVPLAIFFVILGVIVWIIAEESTYRQYRRSIKQQIKTR